MLFAFDRASTKLGFDVARLDTGELDIFQTARNVQAGLDTGAFSKEQMAKAFGSFGFVGMAGMLKELEKFDTDRAGVGGLRRDRDERGHQASHDADRAYRAVERDAGRAAGHAGEGQQCRT